MRSAQINNEFKYSLYHLDETIKDIYESSLEPYLDATLSKLKELFSTNDFTYAVNGEIKIWHSKQERYLDLREMDLERVCWKILAHVIYRKECTFTEIVGKIYRDFNHSTDRQNIESATEIISVMSQDPYFNIIEPRNSDTGTIKVVNRILISPSTQKYLNELKFDLPLLSKPAKLTKNNQTGYYTIKGSVLSKGKHHSKEVNLNHLNRANSVELSLNTDVLLNTAPKWKEKAGESSVDRSKRLETFNQMNMECVELYAQLQSHNFYLTHSYCERGRTYSRGYHVNTQGDDYRKAAVELAHKEVILP